MLTAEKWSAWAALLLRGGHPSGSVIFGSDFSNTRDDWQVQPDASSGRIGNGSYFVRAASSGDTEIAVPANASRVYPSAPADLRIDVTARDSKGPAGQVQYADRASPLGGGTVGMFTSFYSNSIPNGVEAAFQHFAVRHI